MMQKRILIPTILLFAIVGCPTRNATREIISESETEQILVAKKGEQQLPRTVKEAVTQILKGMSDKDKKLSGRQRRQLATL
ncbi:MAG: hypothetical protein QF577_06390 [Phycisphaerae bacterium]|jgi:hypothetical protein|nr:hypothetical protein [Lentisphaeria bacterium]MDP7637160.1 hypothetical protein [Phycisphaerae bacterium]